VLRGALVAVGLVFSANAGAIGAIAVDKADSGTEPAYGYAINYPTREAAERAAVDYCRDYDGEDCQSIVWFEGCGAYANSRRYFGYGWGASKEVAEQKALEMCSNAACKVVVSVCDAAVEG
jgi:hypothetical protein